MSSSSSSSETGGDGGTGKAPLSAQAQEAEPTGNRRSSSHSHGDMDIGVEDGLGGLDGFGPGSPTIALSPANTVLSGQSAFSYNQMTDDAAETNDARQQPHNTCSSLHQQHQQPPASDDHGGIGMSRVGSTSSHQSHQTLLTTVTDWTQMERIYRDSSVCTEAIEANGLKDPFGFVLICLVIFVGEMARGIMLPTLWGFVQHLGGDTVTMGWAVAAFSFGRVLTSPIFGYLSVERGYAFTLTIALTILSMGAFLYAQTDVVGSPLFLIFAQCVMGIGSGTLGVTRAYVAEVSPKKLRTRFLAYLAMTRDAGFTVTPFFGSALAYYFTDDDGNAENVVDLPYFKLNQYTSPAYLLFICCVVETFMVAFFLQHRRREVMPKIRKQISSRLKEASEPPAAVVLGQQKAVLDMTVVDLTIWGIVILNIISKGALSTYETLGVKLADEVFGVPSTTVGLTIGICGIIGVLILLNFKHVSKCFTDAQLVIGGQLFFATGIAIMTDYGNGNMNLAKFFSGFFFIFALGFPINDTSVVGLFSKVCGNKPQGTLQGLLAMSSAIARLVMPILSAYVSQYLSMKALFIGVNIILVLSALVVVRYRPIIELLSSSIR